MFFGSGCHFEVFLVYLTDRTRARYETHESPHHNSGSAARGAPLLPFLTGLSLYCAAILGGLGAVERVGSSASFVGQSLPLLTERADLVLLVPDHEQDEPTPTHRKPLLTS